MKQKRVEFLAPSLLDSLRSSCCPSRDACCSRPRKCGRVSVMKRCRGPFCHSSPSPPPLRPGKSSTHWATRSPTEVRSPSKGLSRCWRGGGRRSRGWRVNLVFFSLGGGSGFYPPSEFKDEVLEGSDSVQQLVSSLGAEVLNPCLWEQSRILKLCTECKSCFFLKFQ